MQVLYSTIAGHEAIDVLCPFASPQDPRQVIDQPAEARRLIISQFAESDDVPLWFGNQVPEMHVVAARNLVRVTGVDDLVLIDDPTRCSRPSRCFLHTKHDTAALTPSSMDSS